MFEEDEITAMQKKKKPPTPASRSTQDFCNRSKDEILKSTSFNYFYGMHPDNFVTWNIRGDQEFIKVNLLPDEIYYPQYRFIKANKR